MGLSVERFKDLVRVADQLPSPKNLVRGSGLSLALLITVGVASPEPVIAGLVMQDTGCQVPQAPSNLRVDKWTESDDETEKIVDISWEAQDGDLGYHVEFDDFRRKGTEIIVPDYAYNSISISLKGDTNTIYRLSVFARSFCGWGSEATTTVSYYRAA